MTGSPSPTPRAATGYAVAAASVAAAVGARLTFGDAPVLAFALTAAAVLAAVGATYESVRAARRPAAPVQATEDGLRHVAAAVKGIIYEFDLRTGRVERTRGLLEVVGFDPAEVPPTPDWWVSRIHPDDRPETVDLFQHAQTADDAPTRTEYRVRHKDGRWVHVEDHAVLVRDAAGRVVKMVGCTMDVTDRVRAEADLRDAQARLKATLSAAEVSTWTWDVRADRVAADRNLARLFGVSAADANGGPAAAYLAAVHPDDRDRVAAVLRRAIDECGSYEVAYRVRQANGRDRSVIARGRVEVGPDGRPARLPGVLIDVTRQKQAEDALRASEERYRAFVANTADGVYRVEFDPPVDTALPPAEQADRLYRAGRIAECNDVFAKMHSLDAAAEVVGRGLGLILPPADPAAREYLLVVVRAGYRAADVESAGRDADGRSATFAHSVVGVVEGGRLVRMWGTQRVVPAARRAVIPSVG